MYCTVISYWASQRMKFSWHVTIFRLFHVDDLIFRLYICGFIWWFNSFRVPLLLIHKLLFSDSGMFSKIVKRFSVYVVHWIWIIFPYGLEILIIMLIMFCHWQWIGWFHFHQQWKGFCWTKWTTTLIDSFVIIFFDYEKSFFFRWQSNQTECLECPIKCICLCVCVYVCAHSIECTYSNVYTFSHPMRRMKAL